MSIVVFMVVFIVLIASMLIALIILTPMSKQQHRQRFDIEQEIRKRGVRPFLLYLIPKLLFSLVASIVLFLGLFFICDWPAVFILYYFLGIVVLLTIYFSRILYIIKRKI